MAAGCAAKKSLAPLWLALRRVGALELPAREDGFPFGAALELCALLSCSCRKIQPLGKHELRSSTALFLFPFGRPRMGDGRFWPRLATAFLLFLLASAAVLARGSFTGISIVDSTEVQLRWQLAQSLSVHHAAALVRGDSGDTSFPLEHAYPGKACRLHCSRLSGWIQGTRAHLAGQIPAQVRADIQSRRLTSDAHVSLRNHGLVEEPGSCWMLKGRVWIWQPSLPIKPELRDRGVPSPGTNASSEH